MQDQGHSTEGNDIPSDPAEAQAEKRADHKTKEGVEAQSTYQKFVEAAHRLLDAHEHGEQDEEKKDGLIEKCSDSLGELLTEEGGLANKMYGLLLEKWDGLGEKKQNIAKELPIISHGLKPLNRVGLIDFKVDKSVDERETRIGKEEKKDSKNKKLMLEVASILAPELKAIEAILAVLERLLSLADSKVTERIRTRMTEARIQEKVRMQVMRNMPAAA